MRRCPPRPRAAKARGFRRRISPCAARRTRSVGKLVGEGSYDPHKLPGARVKLPLPLAALGLSPSKPRQHFSDTGAALPRLDAAAMPGIGVEGLRRASPVFALT